MPEIIFLRYNQIQTILKVHYGTKEAIAEQIWCQINFFKNGSCIRSICLKTAPTIGVEISDKQKVTALIRYLFYFNLTGIGFALASMPFKQLLAFSYGKELYKETLSLQQQKIKKTIVNNHLIFLERCIHHNLTPKAFQLKSAIKTKKSIHHHERI